MKKFQKINEKLFNAIPENKLNSLTGGFRTGLTHITSTCSCEGIDAGDVSR